VVRERRVTAHSCYEQKNEKRAPGRGQVGHHHTEPNLRQFRQDLQRTGAEEDASPDLGEGIARLQRDHWCHEHRVEEQQPEPNDQRLHHFHTGVVHALKVQVRNLPTERSQDASTSSCLERGLCAVEQDLIPGFPSDDLRQDNARAGDKQGDPGRKNENRSEEYGSVENELDLSPC
jgi:hypothetical protein